MREKYWEMLYLCDFDSTVLIHVRLLVSQISSYIWLSSVRKRGLERKRKQIPYIKLVVIAIICYAFFIDNTKI